MSSKHSSGYKARLHTQRTVKRQSKRRAAKAAHRRTETPGRDRIPTGKTQSKNDILAVIFGQRRAAA